MELIRVTSARFPVAAEEALRRAIGEAGRVVLGLPTGRTMEPVYTHMRGHGMRFPAEMLAFALDEYCWPEIHHPGTNASFFREHWPGGAGFPPIRLPRADAPDPDAEIRAHCRAIADAGGLDVLLLGIGRNGHIGFNEPGSARDAACRAVPLEAPTRDQVRDVWPEPPTLGMTLGVREIMQAGAIVLCATGNEKAEILKRALSGPITSTVPASYLQEHPRLTVVCDEEAGTPR